MKRSRPRRGYMLLEISVSAAILAVMASLVAQSLLAHHRQQQSIHWREAAIIEAGNLMERAAALPEDELALSALEALPVGESLQQRTPPAVVRWQLETPVGDPSARRITLEIRLPGKPGTESRPVQLTAWRHTASPHPSD